MLVFINGPTNNEQSAQKAKDGMVVKDSVNKNIQTSSKNMLSKELNLEHHSIQINQKCPFLMESYTQHTCIEYFQKPNTQAKFGY